MDSLKKLSRKELENYTKRLEVRLEKVRDTLAEKDLTYRKYTRAVELLDSPV